MAKSLRETYQFRQDQPDYWVKSWQFSYAFQQTNSKVSVSDCQSRCFWAFSTRFPAKKQEKPVCCKRWQCRQKPSLCCLVKTHFTRANSFVTDCKGSVSKTNRNSIQQTFVLQQIFQFSLTSTTMLSFSTETASWFSTETVLLCFSHFSLLPAYYKLAFAQSSHY